MATDTTKLQGEIIENPENQEIEVETLLSGLLRALLEEQKLTQPAVTPVVATPRLQQDAPVIATPSEEVRA